MDAEDPIATVGALEGFSGRGAGSDAERRAANWLAAQCSTAGHRAEIESFWCRPNWALAHLWHVALAVTGSLIALASPIAGIVLLAVGLASVISDALAGLSLGRRLTPERASQNVIVTPAGQSEGGSAAARLLLTANYDAGRAGLAYRLKPASVRLTSLLHGLTPGWLGWLSLAMVWLLVIAVLRGTGHTSKIVGAAQLIPTVGLLIAFALLLELATGDWSPAAGDNATGVAAALRVSDSLLTSPPKHLQVEVALTGAGDGEQIGLRRYLGLRRRSGPSPRRRPWPSRRTTDTIVLGIAPCGAGAPHWWRSDGAFLPLRYSAALRRTAEQVAADEAYLGAKPQRNRGNSVALPARATGLPALTIGCLESRGVLPRSHMRTDVADAVDPRAVERTVQFALLLIDGIDAEVGRNERRPSATPA